jgi:hypothetical protein
MIQTSLTQGEIAIVSSFFEQSLIGVRPDVLSAQSLKSYVEFGYLTKKQLC